MKKIILAMLLLITGAHTASMAQAGHHQRKNALERTDMIMKKLTEELTLTDAQQPQVRELILKREKLRDAGQLPDDTREQIVADINKVLTPEQQKQWAALRKEARSKYQNHQKGKGQGTEQGEHPSDEGF